MIVCTGRGTHTKAELYPSGPELLERPGITRGWRQYEVRVSQGHQPRFTRYYCERCGADKRLGRRRWQQLCRAEDELGEVDISRLPF